MVFYDVILLQYLIHPLTHPLTMEWPTLVKMIDTWSSWTGSAPNHPPHHTNNQSTAFKNPWPSAEAPTWSEILKTKFPLHVYDDLVKKYPKTRDVKVVTPDWGKSSLESRGLARDGCIVGTLLGHAGAIVEIPLEGTAGHATSKKSFWVVYDPIFSSRAGPTQYTGPQRLKKPPCEVIDLPGLGSRFSYVFPLINCRL